MEIVVSGGPLIEVASHPLLHARAFTADFAAPLGDTPSPPWLRDLLKADAPAPLSRDEATRVAVRDLLRSGGYKPTGRGKPASEYLVRAAEEGALGSINALVDACNVASLHSGLPISVVDLDLVQQPLGIAVAAAGARYVFNAAGQEIDVEGLICLHDVLGPCANAVKDSQRTKTSAATRRALAVVWGTTASPGRAARTAAWYREMLANLGATTEEIGSAP